MEFFRSADMDLYELSFPKDNAWEIMDNFGSLDLCHFVDLNKDEQVFTLTYASKIKRIEEVLKKLTSVIEEEANRINLPMAVPADLASYKAALRKQTKLKHRSPQGVFEIVEGEIYKHAKLIEEQQVREEQMHQQFIRLIERREVLKTIAHVLKQSDNDDEESQKFRESLKQVEASENLLGEGGLKIGHLAGIIGQSEKDRLQKMIFRATRGTALAYFQNIEKPLIDYKGFRTHKCVYIIIFQDGEYYHQKLTRILDSFLGHRVEVSDANAEQELKDIERNITDIRKTMKACYVEITEYIKAINILEGTSISKIQLYKLFLVKEKCLYENLNKMKLGKKFFVGVFWLPVSDVSKMREAMEVLYEKKDVADLQVHCRKDHNMAPPTYIRTNEFTAPFQEITNTYGVPSYKEVNPSLFGIISFPFLFGVMFGDIGHGTLLFLFGSFLCLQINFLKISALRPFLPYRYLLLLMGFFAMFNGWIYNDMMSIPVEKYDSCIEYDEYGGPGEFKED